MNSGGRGARDDRINFEAKGLARISAHGTLVGRIIHGRGGNNLLPSSSQTEGLEIRSFESRGNRHLTCVGIFMRV